MIDHYEKTAWSSDRNYLPGLWWHWVFEGHAANGARPQNLSCQVQGMPRQRANKEAAVKQPRSAALRDRYCVAARFSSSLVSRTGGAIGERVPRFQFRRTGKAPAGLAITLAHKRTPALSPHLSPSAAPANSMRCASHAMARPARRGYRASWAGHAPEPSRSRYCWNASRSRARSFLRRPLWWSFGMGRKTASGISGLSSGAPYRRRKPCGRR